MSVNKLNDNKLKALLKKPVEKESWIADGDGLAIRAQTSGNLARAQSMTCLRRKAEVSTCLRSKKIGQPDVIRHAEIFGAQRRIDVQRRELLGTHQFPQ